MNASPAQAARHLTSVYLGQEYVEQDQVVLVRLRKVEGKLAVGGRIHDIAFFAQPLLDERRHILFVFNQQNTHLENPRDLCAPCSSVVGPERPRLYP